MAASQMNIRMDNMLKQSGNAALSSLGITPSQAVRALWEFLTIQQTLPSELLRLLHPKETPHATELDSGHEGRVLSLDSMKWRASQNPAKSRWTTTNSKNSLPPNN